MEWVLNYAWIIPLFPLTAFTIQVFFGEKLGERTSRVGIIALGLAFSMAALVLSQVIGGASIHQSVPWVTIGETEIEMGYRIANLEAVLLFVVSFVVLLIQIYSVGYMEGDERYNRFFANVNLFATGMLALLMADNFILFLISWEIMGLCSYLLIGHWFEDLENAKAAMKAFMTTRVGDVGLMLGVWVLFSYTRSFNFEEVFHAVEAGAITGPALTAAALFLFMGSVGKSAQIPLHVWLPDAMAGPTPVSALIHAATMVAAGVFLVARTYPIFHLSPHAMLVVAVVGAVTAFVAASIATVVEDIKGVLAYSTISQLGYMILALGVGGYTAAMFHLMTHAVFKGLLFLGSGSVIHAVHTQNMHEMGGLWNKMRGTAITFIIGTLALAGIPPFAGFFSKDEILLAAFHSEYTVLYWLGVGAALLTAYYMTRAVILTFFGEPRDQEAYEHAHESPPVMVWPMIFLAGGATVAGFANAPMFGHWLHHFIQFGHHEINPSTFVQFSALGAAGAGIGLGYLVYGTNLVPKRRIIEALRPLYTALKRRLYFDEVYGVVFIEAGLVFSKLHAAFDFYVVDGIVNGVASVTAAFSRLTSAFDNGVIDAIVDGIAVVTEGFARLSGAFDDGVIDGVVDGVGNTAVASGAQTRKLVSGFVQAYVLTLAVALLAGLLLYSFF